MPRHEAWLRKDPMSTMSVPEETQLALRIGQLFRRRRVDDLGLSLREVEAATGVSSSQINRIENGQTLRPSYQNIFSLAAFYKIPIEELAGMQKVVPLPEAETFMTLAETVARNTRPDQLAYATTFLRMFLHSLTEEPD